MNDNLFGITNGILCQQVNCQGAMGAGLAKAIYTQFPIVKETYERNYQINKGKQFGRYQIIPVIKQGNISNLSVANIYSQDKYGNPRFTHKIYTDADKLIQAITDITKKYPEENIYIPYNIGCGLGGEKWENIYERLCKIPSNHLYLAKTLTKEIEKIETNYELEEENERI